MNPLEKVILGAFVVVFVLPVGFITIWCEDGFKQAVNTIKEFFG